MTRIFEYSGWHKAKGPGLTSMYLGTYLKVGRPMCSCLAPIKICALHGYLGTCFIGIQTAPPQQLSRRWLNTRTLDLGTPGLVALLMKLVNTSNSSHSPIALLASIHRSNTSQPTTFEALSISPHETSQLSSPSFETFIFFFNTSEKFSFLQNPSKWLTTPFLRPGT